MGRYSYRPGTSQGLVYLTGRSEVMERLNREVWGIKERSKQGMHLVGLLVRRAATPLTPVDKGNLRGSQGHKVISGATSGEIGVVIYYTASYAPYVHEIDKNYQSPGTQWKYLETALMRNTKEILETLRTSARVEGGVFTRSARQLTQEVQLSAGFVGFSGEGI